MSENKPENVLDPMSVIRILIKDGFNIFWTTNLTETGSWEARFECVGAIKAQCEAGHKTLAEQAGALAVIDFLRKLAPNKVIANCIIPDECFYDTDLCLKLDKLLIEEGYPAAVYVTDQEIRNGRELFTTKCGMGSGLSIEASYDKFGSEVLAAKSAWEMLTGKKYERSVHHVELDIPDDPHLKFNRISRNAKPKIRKSIESIPITVPSVTVVATVSNSEIDAVVQKPDSVKELRWKKLLKSSKRKNVPTYPTGPGGRGKRSVNPPQVLQQAKETKADQYRRGICKKRIFKPKVQLPSRTSTKRKASELAEMSIKLIANK